MHFPVDNNGETDYTENAPTPGEGVCTGFLLCAGVLESDRWKAELPSEQRDGAADETEKGEKHGKTAV